MSDIVPAAPDGTAVSVLPAAALPALPEDVIAAARGYAAASRSKATLAKYREAWAHFAAWCAGCGHQALPAHAATVAGYLAAEAKRGASPSWCQIKLSAIGHAHRRAGRQPPHRAEHGPLIAEIMAGIRREHGRPPARKAAIDADICRDVIQAIAGDRLRDVRDRALISFGMAACVRRSELVALEVSDLKRTPEGFRVMIRRSKGDQEGHGVEIAVPEGRRLRPVSHLEVWLDAGRITEGPLFRRISNDGKKVTKDAMSDRGVAIAVKQRVAAAGLDAEVFSAHSLRAGFLTAAAASGASVFAMQAQSRHKSLDVLSGYVRSARLFEGHAGAGFL